MSTPLLLGVVLNAKLERSNMRRNHICMRGRDKQISPVDMMLCQETHGGTLSLSVHKIIMVVLVIKCTVTCGKELG